MEKRGEKRGRVSLGGPLHRHAGADADVCVRLEAGSRTGGGSAEAPQRLGSGARPGSLEGRLSGTRGNHREWLERRRGDFVRFLHPDPVSQLHFRMPNEADLRQSGHLSPSSVTKEMAES